MACAADLPNDVVLRILTSLPAYAKPWCRGVCQASAEHLKGHTAISARQTDLPLWLLQQAWEDVVSNSDSSNSKTTSRQAQLLAARAAAGDLAGVQWLRAQGCAWGSLCCIAAAEAGQVHVLSWLLSQRPQSCPIDAGTAALAAAAAGRLAVLQFLKSEFLLRPFDLAACAEAAAAAGHTAVLDWLVLQDSQVQAAAQAAMADNAVAAATRQQVQQIMRFARRRAPLAVAVRA